jgi:hypothetical protein
MRNYMRPVLLASVLAAHSPLGWSTDGGTAVAVAPHARYGFRWWALATRQGAAQTPCHIDHWPVKSSLAVRRGTPDGAEMSAHGDG